MKRVTGIGGIFFKSKDPEKLRAWYKQHLGIPAEQYGAMIEWGGPESEKGYTVWNPFKADTTYFGPSESSFMINYRVDDLEALLKVLEEEGVTIAGKMEEHDYGKFGWIMDPDGNKIELWEPK